MGLILFVTYLKISEKKEKDYQLKTLEIAVRICNSLIMLGLLIWGYQEKVGVTLKSGNDYLPTGYIFLIAFILFGNLVYYSKYLYNKKFDEEKYDLDKELKRNIVYNFLFLILIFVLEMLRMRFI